MERIAVFPGSFDPITIGHESVVMRALPLFDKIILAIGENSSKHNFFPIEQRKEWIRIIFKDYPQVDVQVYSGLTIDYCKRVGAGFLLRGLRTSADFEFERSIGQTNRKLNSAVETIFMLTLPEHTFISSSVVRDIVKHGGDATPFVPNAVQL